MANLLGCPSCYNVKLPSCFENLVVTLEPDTEYDAVFTNHFGKKKIISIETESDGSAQISKDNFPAGYFTSFNPITLEFFLTLNGGYYGAQQEGNDCKAVTVCGDAVCYTLEFYDTEDALETATIKCCVDCDCQAYTEITTVGDFKALVQPTGFNYLVIGGLLTEDIATDGLTYTLITNQLDDLPNDALFSDLLNWDKFYHYHCSFNILGASGEEESNNCQCSVPVSVTTAGDIVALFSPGIQNFLHLTVPNVPNLGTVSFALLLSDDALATLAGVPADTLIQDALEGDLFDQATSFRFMTCTDIEFGNSGQPSTPAITSFSLDKDPDCVGEALTLTVELVYENIPEGSSAQLFSLVGSVETAITNSVNISGTSVKSWTESDLIQTPDTGTNYIKVVITGASLEQTISNVEIPSCEPQPSLEITAADFSCDPEQINQHILAVTFEIENIPVGTVTKWYSLIDGIETEIQSGTDFDGTGMRGENFGAGVDFDLGDNYIKIIMTLPDESTLEDSFDFTAVSCEPSMEITSASQDGCFDGSPTFAVVAPYLNIPSGSSALVTILSSGVDVTLASSSPEGNGYIDIAGFGAASPPDLGANRVKVVITLPDMSTLEDTFDLTVTSCEPSLNITAAEQIECNGSFPSIDVTYDFSNIPLGSTIKLYVLISGVDTEVSSDSISGDGVDSILTVVDTAVDTGANHAKIVITLPDMSTIEDSFDFTVTSCP